MGLQTGSNSTRGSWPVWSSLLLLVVVASSSGVRYERHDNYRCGSIIRTATVSSLTTCAAFCNQESDCEGFLLGVVGGRQRDCQLSQDDSTLCTPEDSYHFYSKEGSQLTPPTTTPPTTTPPPTTVTTLPPPLLYTIELKYYPASKDDKCSGDHVITTVVTAPGDSNMSDFMYFVCSKFTEEVADFKLGDQTPSVRTGDSLTPTAESCENNSTFFGFYGETLDGEETTTNPDELMFDCYELENWYLDMSDCETVTDSQTAVVWGDGHDINKVNTPSWDHYLTCPDYYMPVQLQRTLVNDHWQFSWMKCCHVLPIPV